MSLTCQGAVDAADFYCLCSSARVGDVGIGILFGCFGRNIEGFRSLVYLVVFLTYQAYPSFSPKRTPMDVGPKPSFSGLKVSRVRPDGPDLRANHARRRAKMPPAFSGIPPPKL